MVQVRVLSCCDDLQSEPKVICKVLYIFISLPGLLKRPKHLQKNLFSFVAFI